MPIDWERIDFPRHISWYCLRDEIELVLELMTDNELLAMHDKLDLLMRDKVYRQEEFPTTWCGIIRIQNLIMFNWWRRRGKGIKGVSKIEVCELEDSPYEVIRKENLKTLKERRDMNFMFKEYSRTEEKRLAVEKQRTSDEYQNSAKEKLIEDGGKIVERSDAEWI